MKRRSASLIAPIVLLLFAGAGFGSTASSTVLLRANLTAALQTPKQVVSAPQASARFTGTLVRKNGRNTLSWRLTYSELSSQPTLANIILPRGTNQTEVVVQLCKGQRCRVRAGGPSEIPTSVA